MQVGLQKGDISGTLCAPPGATAVQLLTHGWTYGQQYFDFPYKPEKYSYAQAANKAGYATLAIDRIGAGESIHPLSVFNTFNADVKTVHSVVQALRSGQLGKNFSKVIGVGHSLGSLITAAEAGQYRDLDAIITTGYAHVINYTNVALQIAGPATDYPATTDTKFSKSNLDPGYITSVPGGRHRFHNTQTTDPEVISQDERLKETQSLTEIADVPTEHLVNNDRTLNIPVLAVTGENDQGLCGLQAADCSSSESLQSHERPWYGPHAEVEGYVVPEAGHDVQLAQNSPTTSARMLQFANKHVGPGGGKVGTTPGKRPPKSPPPKGDLNPAALAVNRTFVKAVAPTFRQLANESKIVPGLGTQDEDPSHLGDKLHLIGNINDAILGTLPREVIGTL